MLQRILSFIMISIIVGALLFPEEFYEFIKNYIGINVLIFIINGVILLYFIIVFKSDLLIVENNSGSKLWNLTALFGALVFGVGVGLFFGHRMIDVHYLVVSDKEYDVLKDSIFYILTIITILIGIGGTAAYYTINKKILIKLDERWEDYIHFNSADVVLTNSYTVWARYNFLKEKDEKKDEPERNFCIECAIHFAEKAMEKYQKIRNRDIKDYILLGCGINNNLMCYLVYGNCSDKKETIEKCLKYVKKHYYQSGPIKFDVEKSIGEAEEYLESLKTP